MRHHSALEREPSPWGKNGCKVSFSDFLFEFSREVVGLGKPSEASARHHGEILTCPSDRDVWQPLWFHRFHLWDGMVSVHVTNQTLAGQAGCLSTAEGTEWGVTGAEDPQVWHRLAAKPTWCGFHFLQSPASINATNNKWSNQDALVGTSSSPDCVSLFSWWKLHFLHFWTFRNVTNNVKVYTHKNTKFKFLEQRIFKNTPNGIWHFSERLLKKSKHNLLIIKICMCYSIPLSFQKWGRKAGNLWDQWFAFKNPFSATYYLDD